MRQFILGVLVATVVSGAAAQDFLSKGKGALTTGDTAAAITAFQGAIKANQKPAEANAQLGAIALAQGKVDEAIRYLEASVKIDDENPQALKLLGGAYLRKKDLQSALTALRKAERLAKKDPDVLAMYGLALVEADSVDAAIRVLTLAKEYDANNPNVYKGLAEAYLKQGVAPLGISNYQKAIELDPKNISIRMTLAQVYNKQRQYTEAVKEYDGVIAIDSTYSPAYLAKGNILVAAKLYPRAIPALRKYMQLQPRGTEGSVLLAKALYGAEDYPEAAKAATSSLALDSSNADVWRIYANSLAETKDNAGALAGYEALKRRNAFKPEDQARYGIALYGMGKEDEAMNALLAAVEADSTNCDPFFTLGSIYMKKQEYEKAASMYERRIVCDPRSLSAYINAAASHMQTKNYQRAHELLTKSIELKSDFLLGRLYLARTLSLMDSAEAARAEYEEVLRQAEKDPAKYKKELGEAHYMIASGAFVKQNYDRAIESYRKAQSAGYDNAELQLAWGQAVLLTVDPKRAATDNRSKVEEAVRHFRRSIEMNASNAQAHLWLAQSLLMLRVEGDDAANRQLAAEACDEFRKVLRLNPNNEDAKKGMERVGCPGTGK